MLNRCTNKNSIDYERYKDLPIDPRWRTSFLAFYEDMGDRPDNTTLDRIDNEKGYCKENCRWATPVQQARNRRVFRTNRVGVTGVHYVEVDKVWRAWGFVDKKKVVLYRGKDLLEACCARKSWELRR